jgi:hypothetical protein
VKILRPSDVLSEEDRHRYTEEIEISPSAADWQRLETEAEALGVSVDDLIAYRLSHNGDDPPDPAFEAQVFTFQQDSARIAKDLQPLQAIIRTLHQRDAPRETILAIVTFITQQLQALTKNLHIIKGLASDTPEILESAALLQAEIDKTTKAILETGFIGA